MYIVVAWRDYFCTLWSLGEITSMQKEIGHNYLMPQGFLHVNRWEILMMDAKIRMSRL